MNVRYQVFVSSTYSDLKEEREHVIHELTRIGYIAVGMEQFPATPEEQMEYIERVIDESDYYVVIVRGKYGSLAADGLSFTEKEFDYAVKTNKPAIAFIYRDPGSIKINETDDDLNKAAKLKDFLQKLQARRNVKYWDNKVDLTASIKDSVNDLIRRKPGVGWIRGDQAIDPKIVNDLERLRRENLDLAQKLEIRKNEEIIGSSLNRVGRGFNHKLNILVSAGSAYFLMHA